MKSSFVAGLVSVVLSLPVIARPPAPILDGLGNVEHPVTTESKEAQRYFNQGLRLCFAFNHQEAIRSFQAAAKLDPSCAMAFWGEAYALGPHVNKPMTEQENRQAWQALQKARANASKASSQDQAYIEALSSRYQQQFVEDRSELDKAYAAAMRKVAKRYPDDFDAQTLLAEALMDTMPWDYWAKDRSPRPETEEALAALRYVIKRDPDHPGANHLYIHAIEAGPTPELGIPSAESLGNTVENAGHLVHMPCHIFMRVGRYQDASTANERAVKADQRYIRSCAAQGFYPGAYYPHNIHFLWWAKVFEGRSKEALKAAEKAVRFANENVCGPTQVVEAPRFRHLGWLTCARFGRWDEILAVDQPPATNDFLVDRAMWHFARGLALVAQGDSNGAEAEHQALARITKDPETSKLDSPQFPVSDMLRVADYWLAGKVAESRGDSAGAIRALRQAVEAEDALAYMEPSYWPIPTRPTLGAALLRAGEAAKAEAVFREDLSRTPRNGWGLLGLEESLRKQGKDESAEAVKRQFAEAWQRADTPLKLEWF